MSTGTRQALLKTEEIRRSVAGMTLPDHPLALVRIPFHPAAQFFTLFHRDEIPPTTSVAPKRSAPLCCSKPHRPMKGHP
ncbi:MAG: hypothetical protein H0W83_06185 [Planctomycetes bacterium]|nr:hypothetical protein [Planctomycetota bacterium]